MIENLIRELRENFATGVSGFRKLKTMPEEYPAWTILNERESYGVAIPNPHGEVINEHFANVSIESHKYIFGSETKDMLILLCSSSKLRYEFATIAAQFVEPGTGNANRNSIQRNPFSWWKNWRELMGNRIGDKMPYAVIGEMLAVEYLMDHGKIVSWGGPNARSHDIDIREASIEVKSTLQKSRTEVTISSDYQLDGDKPLWLYIVKFEENPKDGLTISDQADILVQKGYDRHTLEQQLTAVGFGVGTNGRKQRFRILEKRRYLVDESFPRITAKSFVGGQRPAGITHIEYTVNLDGIMFEKW